jgi:hypothetical protein
LLDIQRNLHRLVGKTCAGAGISRPRDPGGLIETYPDLGRRQARTVSSLASASIGFGSFAATSNAPYAAEVERKKRQSCCFFQAPLEL